MTWLLIGVVVYILLLAGVCLRIIFDTRSSSKTLAYLLVVVLVPLLGMFLYFSFGVNYRKRRLYSKKLIEDEVMAQKLTDKLMRDSEEAITRGESFPRAYSELARMLLRTNTSAVTDQNTVKILRNGEEKFPELLSAMRGAKHHIHIEYYIFEDDEIGRAIERILVDKARSGVKVRMMYDDFGSRSVRRKMVARLRAGGVEAIPFFSVRLIPLANRINYRNHRKIVVIDGMTGFTGGINVSDRYINTPGSNRLYWRDTHVRIDGPGVRFLQHLFRCDWNFASGQSLEPDSRLFPPRCEFPALGKQIVQIAASGPDSETPNILYALISAINLASEELLITTPYFIPDVSMQDMLIMAALGGVKVRLLVPGKTDVPFVNSAARSYYSELLDAGVEVYLYRKGFIHAKTLVSDRKVAIVGTANMDSRSFSLNFEVSAILYDRDVARQLSDMFFRDLEDAQMIDKSAWDKRPGHMRLAERTARLISPLL